MILGLAHTLPMCQNILELHCSNCDSPRDGTGTIAHILPEYPTYIYLQWQVAVYRYSFFYYYCHMRTYDKSEQSMEVNDICTTGRHCT